MANDVPLLRRVAAEFIATAFLLMAVVGSGIAAQNLSGGNDGVALLANAIATGCALYVLILSFAPISGAHMNPIVTLAAVVLAGFDKKVLPFYWLAQVAGAVVGVMVAHAMFDLPIVQTGSQVRSGTGQWLAESVATLGLLVVIWRCVAHGTPVLAGAVGAYITGAYWFTASTSFANPAVTIARAFTDTFASIRPDDVLGFIAAQSLGLVVALFVCRFVFQASVVK